MKNKHDFAKVCFFSKIQYVALLPLLVFVFSYLSINGVAYAQRAPLRVWEKAINDEINQKIKSGNFEFILDGHKSVDDFAYRYSGAVNYRKEKFTRDQLNKIKGDTSRLAFSKAYNILIRNCHIDAGALREALKFSFSQNVIVENCTLVGGSEDALDIVRGNNYYFRNVKFIANGRQAATIKSAVSNVYFLNCKFLGNPSTGEYIQLGNWSDYDYIPDKKTTNIFIDSKTVFEQAGKKVNIRKIKAVRKLFADYVVMNAPYKIYRYHPLLIKIYFEIKRKTTGKKYSDHRMLEHRANYIDPVLVDSRVFDLKYYQSSYYDLNHLNEKQVRLHWSQEGVFEGRIAHPKFDAHAYLKSRSDLIDLFGASNHWSPWMAIRHYISTQP
jgi:hypothetical protein